MPSMRRAVLFALCMALAVGVVPRAEAEPKGAVVHSKERKERSLKTLLSELEQHEHVLGPDQLQILRQELMRARRKSFEESPTTEAEEVGRQKRGGRRNGDFAAFVPTQWVPASLGGGASPLAGNTYQVVIYELEPFVQILDDKGSVDPGNVLQTRTSENGRISGLTIDLLDEVASQLDVELKYYYPCLIADHTANGKCTKATSDDALKMLDDTSAYYGTDANWCVDDKCFVAGAPKITPDKFSSHLVSQRFMSRGFKLVALKRKAEPYIMSWAEPFSFELWLLVLAELLFCAVLFMLSEGYGTNDSLWGQSTWKEGRMWLAQFYDSLYWSITLVLGAADKAPTTNAGRVIVFTQLVFAMFFLAIYTGNLSATLTVLIRTSAVESLDDFVPPLAGAKNIRYSPNNILCVPERQASVSAYLSVQERLESEDRETPFTFNTKNASTLADCLMMVYKGDATATFYDEPVLLYQINQMYAKGMCGNGGGYCTDLQYNKDDCLCPTKNSEGECVNLEKNEFKEIEGELETVGTIFNPFGYGFMFKRSDTATDYIAFGQAVQYLKDSGFVQSLENLYVPNIEELTCATTSSSVIRLGVDNIYGLLMITGFVLIAGVTVGFLEQIIALIMHFCPCGGAEEDDDPQKDEEALDDEFREIQGMDGAKSDEVVQKVSALKERLVAFEKMMSAQDDQGEGEVQDGPVEEEHVLVTLGRSMSKMFAPGEEPAPN